MKFSIQIFTVLLIFIGQAFGMELSQIDYLPEDGVVKNEKCAVAIAVAVLSDVYGADDINLQKPLVAILEKGEIWVVSGTFPIKKKLKGGVAYIKIRKKDGEILGMMHER